ncbi:hypothetical protein [Vulcanisaeta moutnovskia]|uniref:hypothetical protein n=1 Tax=Vulcanisaeta moutnovskia TaxID=985052 RepID=UPI00064ED397|nr:hypothetical protein [Vulcanisaeta moutnovskia]
MDLKKFLLHSLILIALIIELLVLINTQSIEASTQLNYLYSGNYEPIAWPILNVTLTVNKSLTNGIVIIVSPSTESINKAFTGLLILPNNTSYVITGFLGSSLIYIISIERMPNQSVINNQYSQYYETNGRGNIKKNLGNAADNLTTSSSMGNLTKAGGKGESRKYEAPWNLNYPLIVIIVTIIMISVSLATMYMRRSMKYPDCLEYGIMKIMQKMRIREPGITHRELGNYIIDRVNERQTVEEMVRLFEEGMYGNREVNCRRFMTLVRRILKRI